LANNKLGTLSVRRRPNDPSAFFVASPTEIALFDFASDILVAKADWLPISNVSSEKFFNVENLLLSHLPLLFEKQKEPNADKAWLSRFWTYFDTQASLRANVESARGVVNKLPVCLSLRSGKTEVKFLSTLEELPAVVEPSVSAHVKLCERFPGLHIFQRDYIPNSLRTAESSFTNVKSFSRFVTAISRLCPKDRKFGDFVASKLFAEDIKVIFFTSLFFHSANIA
jgi:hypothetical protein